MNYYFTASPPPADLNALSIVTKKQACPHDVVREADIDISPKLLVYYPLLVFSLRCLMREFVSAGGELIFHAAHHIKNSPTPHLFNFD